MSLKLEASSISQCGTVSSIACCLSPGVNAVDLYMPRSRRVNLGPGPVARLLGAVALVGLMAWSVLGAALQIITRSPSLASLPEMGLT